MCRIGTNKPDIIVAEMDVVKKPDTGTTTAVKPRERELPRRCPTLSR